MVVLILFPYGLFLTMKANIIFGTKTSSVKGMNIQRDPRISICVDYQEYPYSFVTIFGDTEPFKRYSANPDIEDKKTLDESNDFLQWMRRISSRYVGSRKADRYAKRNTTEGAILYCLKPQHIVSEKVIADW